MRREEIELKTKEGFGGIIYVLSAKGGAFCKDAVFER